MSNENSTVTYQTDPELGQIVHKYLTFLGIETELNKNNLSYAEKELAIAEATNTILKTLGYSTDGEEMGATPKRVAKMLLTEIHTGIDYNNFPKQTAYESTVHSSQKSPLVVVSGLQADSLCGHHLQPILSTGIGAAVAYLPMAVEDGSSIVKVLGISKLSRLLSFFANRASTNESITNQTYAALSLITGQWLTAEDHKDLTESNFVFTDKEGIERVLIPNPAVAVSYNSNHLCMRVRGVKQNSTTSTSRLGDAILADPALRSEFIAAMNSNR